MFYHLTLDFLYECKIQWRGVYVFVTLLVCINTADWSAAYLGLLQKISDNKSIMLVVTNI